MLLNTYLQALIMTNSKNTRDDFVQIANFFSESDLQKFHKVIAVSPPDRDDRPPHGPWADQLVAKYVKLQDQELQTWIKDFMTELFDIEVDIQSVVQTTLFLPWDIHADFYKNRCRPGYRPFYNFLIPLEDTDSCTIIFDQTTSESNSFHDYKKTHTKANNPVDVDFWNAHLSMCWPQDREYVSLNHVMPLQRKGQLLGFPRRFYHSSDSFHLKQVKSKSFVTILVDRPT